MCLLYVLVQRYVKRLYSTHASVITYAERPQSLPLGEISREIFTLLAEVINTVLEPSDPRYHSEAYVASVRRLETRLESFQSFHGTDDAVTASDTVTELYRLAILVYLERASINYSGVSAKLNTWLEKSFNILGSLDTLRHPFPLLIYGCEARSDDRRVLILDLVTRSSSNTDPQQLEPVHRILQAIWLQDDLETNHELDYQAKLNAIFSSSEIVPSLA